MKLVRADALLGRAHQVYSLEHLVERDTGVLKDRADLHRELLFAVAALVKSETDALLRVRLDLADAAHAAAVGANRTDRPQGVLKPLEGGFLVVELGLAEDGHGLLLLGLYSS